MPNPERAHDAATSGLRIAYLTGEYLRLSPFVFIHREVAALRRLGAHIETFTIRGLADETECVSDAQREEKASTFVVLRTTVAGLLGAHLRLLTTSPRRYGRALLLALRTRPPGFRATLRQAAYFAEAGVVAARMRERGLVHLHNHFASSSGTVALSSMGARGSRLRIASKITAEVMPWNVRSPVAIS